jgi:hypothetical protein
MKLSLIKSVRVTLRGIPDGITLEDLSELLNRSKYNVRKVLKNMPDVYIDRWEVAPRGQYKAVWCIVVPPIDCPKPERTNDQSLQNH